MFANVGELRETGYRSKREDIINTEKSQIHPPAGGVVKTKMVHSPIILEHGITTGGDLDHIMRFKRKQEKKKKILKGQ